ncbi:hypothetical protein DPMN_110043 [Dreissena polymorpha]|uniref:Uncharacterized protein n=1 Tax=Dreissena polymorpha TaxID=45954 RepID=A0A9D4QNI7_DREPO|nr:hypothetical protein DPMN_110043 [Dreissena polymorpha]
MPHVCVSRITYLSPAEVDLVTPLCTQVTYEGLLDDMFGIHCACIEFRSEITQKDHPVKVMLNSEDKVRSMTDFSQRFVYTIEMHC